MKKGDSTINLNEGLLQEESEEDGLSDNNYDDHWFYKPSLLEPQIFKFSTSLRDKLDRSKFTYGRIVAQYFSSSKWYYPMYKSGTTHPLAKYSAQTEAQQMEAPFETFQQFTQFSRPSLEKAWNYFEQVTLPRHIDFHDDEDILTTKQFFTRVFKSFMGKDFDEKLYYAEPGTQHYETKLYSPLTTAQSQVGDFGLGIGLYLGVLRKVSYMLFFAALLSLPNFIYFLSDKYSDGQPGVNLLLKGSAICTRMSLVPCPTCNSTIFDIDQVTHRLVTGKQMETSESLPFALKNNCDGARITQGIVSLVVLIFVYLYFVALRNYQSNMEKELDEDEQTACDYSVVINNPPTDAFEAHEWKDYFEQKFEGVKVACCTIAVKNDFLLKTMVERKEIFFRLESKLAPGTPIDEMSLARIAADIEANWSNFQYIKSLISKRLGLLLDVPSLYDRLIVLDAKIRGLAQLDYPVAKVFITFQSEKMKNNVLSALRVGRINLIRNNLSNTEVLFRGKIVLDIEQPGEPSTVRWTDLNASYFLWAKGQLIAYGYCALLGYFAYLFVTYVNQSSPLLTPYLLSIFNVTTSSIVRFITRFETHPFENGKQLSMFIKGSFFLFVTTFVLVQHITPFASSITQGKFNLIGTVFRVIFFDALFTILLQLFDPVGHFKRHYLAPRAATQAEMNSYFRGAYYDMADRYMNMWKILDMALFYGPIFPMIYALGGMIFLIFSFTDRFSIMRTWYRAPKFGAAISECSRVHTASIASLLMGVIASYFWSGFPFDNLCEVGPADINSYGTYEVDGDSFVFHATNTTIVTINKNTTQYKYCSQNLFGSFNKFPALPRFQPEGAEWMSKNQAMVCTIWGWFTIVLISLILVRYVVWTLPKIWSLVFGGYQKPTSEMDLTYSEWITGEDIQRRSRLNKSSAGTILMNRKFEFEKLQTNNAYLPHVLSPYFSFPLLACSDDDDLICKHYLLKYVNQPKGFFSLVNDARKILNSESLRNRTNVFSTFHYWGESTLEIKMPAVWDTENIQHDLVG